MSDVLSISMKFANKIKVNNKESWEIHENFHPNYCRAIETIFSNGDVELSVIESILVFNIDKKALITVGEYIKPAYRSNFIIDEDTGAFVNQQIIINEENFCLANDPLMQPIYDKSITHEIISNEGDEEEYGDLKDGYITLWAAYNINIGQQALFAPAQAAAYQRKYININS